MGALETPDLAHAPFEQVEHRAEVRTPSKILDQQRPVLRIFRLRPAFDDGAILSEPCHYSVTSALSSAGRPPRMNALSEILPHA
jgi:hypothetical protein